MRISSPAFGSGEPIPKKFTEDGINASPPLTWADVSASVREFALIVEDPDAPRDEPWVHWLIYGIPADVRALPEALPRQETLNNPAGASQGWNSWKQLGYRGPAPPKGDGRHRYNFRLYALDRTLDLAAGVEKGALLSAIKTAHVVAQAEFMGIYQRA